VVHLAHTAAMRKRVHIALAVVLVMLAGLITWQGLRKPEPKREPVYHGKGLRAWLNEYLTGDVQATPRGRLTPIGVRR